MADTPTPSAPSSSSSPIIKANSGSINFDALREISGVNAAKEAPDAMDEADETDGDGGERDDDRVHEEASETDKRSADAEDAELGGDEEEKEPEDNASSLDDIEPATDKRNIRLKTKDGKEFKIPPDAVVIQKVDGKFQEINIRDAINAKVGEFSYEKAKSELEKREQTIVAERDEVKRNYNQLQTTFREIADLSVSDKPERALAKVAEMKGVPPGKVMKDLVLLGLTWAKNFHEKKLTIESLDGIAAAMNEEFYAAKLKEREANDEKGKSRQTLERLTIKAKADYGISHDQFAAAVNALHEKKAFAGKPVEECVRIATAQALAIKHEDLVTEALKAFPKLQGNTKFVAAITEHTDPVKWSVEDIKGLVRDYFKGSTSPKPQPGKALTRSITQRQVATSPNSEPKVVKGYHGLRRVSGLKD